MNASKTHKMQGTKNSGLSPDAADSSRKELAPKVTAKSLLSVSLQELNGQKEEGDTKSIASKLEISVRTVEVYLGGTVASLETGKAIYTVLKSIIIKRENEIRKLVA